MLQTIYLILALLGWSYTDAYGTVHYDNCVRGGIVLYEDISYITTRDPYTVSCIENAYSTNGITDVYIVSVSYIDAEHYRVVDRYYAGGSFPESIQTIIYTVSPDRLWQ